MLSNSAFPPLPHGSIVLHADDFGMTSAVNAGVVQAFEDGLLTSASILANAPATDEALADALRLSDPGVQASLLSRERRARLADPQLPFDFGVHLNLTQGRPLTRGYPGVLLDADGFFPGIGRLFARLLTAPARWRRAIRQELAAQVALACDYGLRPTHLNGHQYIELIPAISGELPWLLQHFAIPVVRVASERGLWASAGAARLNAALRGLAGIKRLFAARFGRRMRELGILFPDAYFGSAHAGRIDASVLASFLQSAAGSKLAEIAWHPGRRPSDRACHVSGWNDPLEYRRPAELALLTSPLLADMLAAAGRRLSRFSALASGSGFRRAAA